MHVILYKFELFIYFHWCVFLEFIVAVYYSFTMENCITFYLFCELTSFFGNWFCYFICFVSPFVCSGTWKWWLCSNHVRCVRAIKFWVLLLRHKCKTHQECFYVVYQWTRLYELKIFYDLFMSTRVGGMYLDCWKKNLWLYLCVNVIIKNFILKLDLWNLFRILHIVQFWDLRVCTWIQWFFSNNIQ